MLKCASRYALALFLLSKEKGVVKETERYLSSAKCIIKNHSFLKNILLHPAIEKDKKQKIINDIFYPNNKKNVVGVNFLKLLIKKNRIKNLEEIFSQYRLLCQEFYGTIEAIVFSAFPLSKSEKEIVSKAIKKITHKKIEIEERIDNTLIAGIKIEYLGKTGDWTVKSRLKKMQERLIGVYQHKL